MLPGARVRCLHSQALSARHALSLVGAGDAQRKVSATEYNEDSSRSHTLCRIMIESCDARSKRDVTVSTLNLIDLAGSESARAAASRNHRMEGSYINKSLLTLGAVIAKLSEKSPGHVPFRDSKLTRLLQSSLSGPGARVAVVCCMTMAAAQVCPPRSQAPWCAKAGNGCVAGRRAPSYGAVVSAQMQRDVAGSPSTSRTAG
jgi:centromeric protein E